LNTQRKEKIISSTARSKHRNFLHKPEAPEMHLSSDGLRLDRSGVGTAADLPMRSKLRAAWPQKFASLSAMQEPALAARALLSPRRA
jgi:hypothetical protein